MMAGSLPWPRIVEPRAYRLGEDGDVPNHPYLPVLHYRQVLPLAEHRAEAFEAVFARHGWPPAWRDVIYPYPHFHVDTHEAFGIVAGAAWVRLGGTHGVEVALRAGDALVLPAGTGHQLLRAEGDFLAVGAYPQGSEVDMSVPTPGALPAQRRRIAQVAPSPADPLYGADGPLPRLWQP